MTDEWLVDGLPIAGDWTGTGPCAPAGNANSIVDTITITGSPGAITSVQNDKSLWALVLNDGTPEADFRLDRFDDAGGLASSPMTIVRATGVVSFNDAVMLAEDPLEDMEAATKHYVDANAAGLTDAPDDGSFYGRKSLTWANPSHSDITDWAAALAPYALLANVPPASTTPPLMDGTAAPGSAGNFARGDHVHPTDTSRYAASNPAGYQTAAQVTASLAPYALTASVPVASSTTPAMDGTAAVGTGTTWARADHVHPSDTSRAPLASPVFTGNPTAPTPTAGDNDTSVATTAFVTTALAAQPVAMNDNRIINGDMRIDQRNNGASGTATGYTVDRWVYGTNQANKGTWGRGSTGPFGFPYYLNFTSSSAYASLAADTFSFNQRIEADMISDLQFGTATAQPITLSFRAYASVAGTFSGAVNNDAGTRAYPFSYTLAANTWTPISVAIPGDTSGTWVMSGNARAMIVYFDLGCGANSRGPAGAWASAGYAGVTGAVSIVATNGANFAVTGVKLEVGSVATPFNRQSLAKSLADCQRYYAFGTINLGSYGAAGATFIAHSPLKATMRAAPTTTVSPITATNCSAFAIVAVADGQSVNFSGTITALGGYQAQASYTAAAEL